MNISATTSKRKEKQDDSRLRAGDESRDLFISYKGQSRCFQSQIKLWGQIV